MGARKYSENNENSGFREGETWVINGWQLDEKCHCLIQGEDVVRLEPKITQLMAYLAARAGEPISREQLLDEVWPGTIVSDESLTNAVNKIRRAFGDSSQNPQVIETIPKMGYRMVAAVIKEISEEKPAYREVIKDHKLSASSDGLSRPRIWLGFASILVVALIAGALWYGQDHDRKQVSTQKAEYTPVKSDHALNGKLKDSKPTISDNKTKQSPTILVLPFRNLGSNDEEEYFIDGITEDIITELSRLSGLLVLASNTSFRYKGQTIVPQEIAKELNASHILEGGVRKAGDKLRITAQLTDTQKGHHIWADRYDRSLTDVFAVQDDVTQNIVNALALHLTDQDKVALTRKYTSSIEAYELFLRGRNLYRKRTMEDSKQAKVVLKEAIKLDPSYARTYGTLALTLIQEANSGWIEDPIEARDRALELARKAVLLDDQSPQVYWSLAFTHLYRKEYEEATDAVKKSIDISPSYADAHALLAFIKNFLGEAEEAIELLNKSMQLNPHYSWDYLWNLGFAYYTLGEFEKANEYLDKAQNRNPNIRNIFLFRAATFMELGMQDEAEWEIEQLLQLYPNLTVSLMSSQSPMADSKALEVFLNHLLNAGLPE